jgi:hypothetical protein
VSLGMRGSLLFGKFVDVVQCSDSFDCLDVCNLTLPPDSNWCVYNPSKQH